MSPSAEFFALFILAIHQSFDEFRGEIDSVRPSNCMRLQRKILKGIDICKLLHNGSVIRLDDAFKISDKTASVVEFDGYLVIANIFRINHMKHNLDILYISTFRETATSIKLIASFVTLFGRS